MSRDIPSEVLGDYRAAYKIRFALYAVFRCCAESARMTALYGQRTAEQIASAMEYESP